MIQYLLLSFRELFRIGLISSNNFDYVETLAGYHICANETDYDLMPSMVIHMPGTLYPTRKLSFSILVLQIFQFKFYEFTNGCGSKKIFIPSSKDEFITALKSQQTSDLEQPLRIWTDYRRTNGTFFWSDIAKKWWSNQNENQFGFL